MIAKAREIKLGEQTGKVTEGQLYYVPYEELERVRMSDIAPVPRAALFATLCRINALYMIARAGSGHIGSSFSSLDLMSWLFLQELENPNSEDGSGDIFFSSKGHDAPGYYSVLIGMGRLDFDLLHRLRKYNGLPGHPDVGTPCVMTNTGSLGMGISKAKGMVRAKRLLGRSGRVFVLTGDGELQEGQFWESLISAANSNFHEITVIIDHNKIQSDTFVSTVSDLGDLAAKLQAFGWHVERCDGHDLSKFSSVLARLRHVKEKPRVVIADTIKGRGVSFMEHTALASDTALYQFHSGALHTDEYVKAVQELINVSNDQLKKQGMDALNLEAVESTVAGKKGSVSGRAHRLVDAYSHALVDQAEKNDRLVALNADLVLDTGLIPFKEKFPVRFVECGIAEQDMVSQAGAMALQGIVPVVHSFACFLSSRPNEQIYNNATENTKVVYVGTLAGLVPGGPGHSHQAVRDIAALRGIPGLVILEPCVEEEVAMALDYCLNKMQGSSYLRLVSLPWNVPFNLPADYRLEEGRGVVLTEGGDAVLFSYGAVMLSIAYRASAMLRETHGIKLKVVNMPWLNRVNHDWLLQVIHDCRKLFSLDNHSIEGGLGDTLCGALSCMSVDVQLFKLGLETFPVCGSNKDVLRHHGLDEGSLVEKIVQRLRFAT